MKRKLQKKFKTVGVGGTFDEFHKGHRALLMKAFEVGEKVLIGLCSDELFRKLKKQHQAAPYEKRLEELRAFLRLCGFLDRAETIPLNDVYGVSLVKGLMEAIVVSKETESVAVMINEKRKELGLPPLHIIAIDMVPSENHVSISTTRIHSGEIDREGHVLRK